MDFGQHSYAIFLLKDMQIISMEHIIIYFWILYCWHFADFNIFYFLVLLVKSVGTVSVQSQGDKFL